MSRLVQIRRGGKAAILVTGTLSGSGNLSILQGAGLVSLTGKGGVGTDNSWYDPGQPYIAPTYVNTWTQHMTYELFYNGQPQSANYYPNIGSGTGPTPSGYSESGEGLGGPGWTYIRTFDFQSTGSTMTDPGQPYIAPSSGGGPQYGPSTTATLNGVTRTWTGGYGSGVQGTISTQTIESDGAGQTLTYGIPGSGSLSYSYEY